MLNHSRFIRRVRTAVLFLLILLLPSCHLFQKEEQQPNVLLIVVDTLAAKHMGMYDTKLDTTPHLNRLAEKSVVFERAYSSAPWTKPAVASIFTSVYPNNHTVMRINHKLPEQALTMAEVLKKLGYLTRGIVSHTLLKEGSGYEQGFDHYEVIPFQGNIHNAIVGKTVSDFAIHRFAKWEEAEEKKPFFFFLHYFDPHFNYQHHPQYDRSSWYSGPLKSGMGFRRLRNYIPKMTEEDRKYLVDLYHEEIEYTDHQVERVLNHLREKGELKNTIVIFTADHGEEFLEHGGLGHTRTLHDELIRVPLMIYWEGKLKPQRVETPVSILDIFPTVLSSITEKELPAHFSGIPLFNGSEVTAPGRREIFAEVDFKSSGIEAKKTGVMRNEFKLIEDHLASEISLFNIEKDPGEQENIAESDPETKGDLKLFLDEHIASGKDASAEGLEHSDEEIEQLKSLGYL